MYPTEELRELKELSHQDLIDYIKQANYVITRLDDKLEDIAPEWYSGAQAISESSDFMRNCENLGLDK